MTARVYTVVILALTLGVLTLAGCAPPIYFAKATHGTVIDAETKQPIAGAVIVANWDLFDELYGGGSHGVRSLQITEVVTDKEGKYVVPGWGPKRRPCFTYLDDRDPYLIIFKSGYVPGGWLNTPSNSWVRVSEANGRTLELKPFSGTPDERYRQLDSVIDQCRLHATPLKELHDEVLKDADLTVRPTALRTLAEQLLLPNQ